MDKYEFTIVDGEKNPGDIAVYALSTCGHCRRAINFLKNNSIRFRYIYVDKLSSDDRIAIKKHLKETYKDQRLGFPFCVVDGKKVIVGFTEEKWSKAMLE